MQERRENDAKSCPREMLHQRASASPHVHSCSVLRFKQRPRRSAADVLYAPSTQRTRPHDLGVNKSEIDLCEHFSIFFIPNATTHRPTYGTNLVPFVRLFLTQQFRLVACGTVYMSYTFTVLPTGNLRTYLWATCARCRSAKTGSPTPQPPAQWKLRFLSHFRE